MSESNIRNFSIIAHIDHGKSTLADRLLEFTGTVSEREMENQLLDNMDLERERGITIKARAVRLEYKAQDNKTYILNLIDTPGHVDFSYEVSRSLKACEGALLVVDASQGIEAQTLANAYLAIDNDLEILPIINKIDLSSAQPDKIRNEIEDVIGIDGSDAVLISAKNGIGIQQVLEHIVKKIPAPDTDENKPFKALIFDSFYDSYKGVIIYVRVFEGKLRRHDRIKLMSNGKSFDVVEIGYLSPLGHVLSEEISAGEVGYISASIKNLIDTQVGDTVTTYENPATESLSGYREANPMVFCGIYPVDGARYSDLRDSLSKLKLNDASLSFEPETSSALGFGFRCGFLGLLHMEIVQERIEREYNLELITTAPSVIYKVIKTDKSEIFVDNPVNLPPVISISHIEEPMVNSVIITPSDYVGNVMELCTERRGSLKDMKYISTNRVQLHYRIPLNEIVYSFFDVLKSKTKGYASFDYELSGYDKSNLVKLDILLNGEIIDALSFVVHRDKAYDKAKKITEKLKEEIPRQLFEVPIQAAIGSKIIARETVRALRKDVLAKCYGGDISRKRKLLEKQKEGKKRMRKVGTIELPQNAFMSVIKID